MSQSNKSFSDYLLNELADRQAKNPRYSLRAFARSLDVEPSLLSKLMREKYRFNESLILDLGHKLKLNESVLQDYIKKNGVMVSNQALVNLDDQQFSQIANIFCRTVLNLVEITQTLDVEALSKAFQISVAEANQHIENLLDLNFIERTENNKYKRVSKTVAYNSNSETEKISADLLKKLLLFTHDSIDKTHFDDRLSANLFFKISKASLPRFEKKMQKFVQEMNRLTMYDANEHDAVYSLVTCLTPMFKASK
jgi:uncharacterized protein (TIGR02147 family)